MHENARCRVHYFQVLWIHGEGHGQFFCSWREAAMAFWKHSATLCLLWSIACFSWVSVCLVCDVKIECKRLPCWKSCCCLAGQLWSCLSMWEQAWLEHPRGSGSKTHSDIFRGVNIHLGVSINGGYQHGWFIMEDPIKMDDFGVPRFRKPPFPCYYQATVVLAHTFCNSCLRFTASNIQVVFAALRPDGWNHQVKWQFLWPSDGRQHSAQIVHAKWWSQYNDVTSVEIDSCLHSDVAWLKLVLSANNP